MSIEHLIIDENLEQLERDLIKYKKLEEFSCEKLRSLLKKYVSIDHQNTLTTVKNQEKFLRENLDARTIVLNRDFCREKIDILSTKIMAIKQN